VKYLLWLINLSKAFTIIIFHFAIVAHRFFLVSCSMVFHYCSRAIHKTLLIFGSPLFFGFYSRGSKIFPIFFIIIIFRWFFHNSQFCFWFLIQWFFIVVFMLFTNVCLFMVRNGFWLIISCLTSLWFFSYSVGLLLLFINLSTIFKYHEIFLLFSWLTMFSGFMFHCDFFIVVFLAFVACGVVFGCCSHAQSQTILYSIYSFLVVFLSNHVTITPFKRWCF